jgi:hypothetical protein
MTKHVSSCVLLTLSIVGFANLAAAQGPPPVSAHVVNTEANPVPVVVTGVRAEELVFFRTGYQVPAGKRLLIDDASVRCAVVGILPHGNNQTIADWERFGVSTDAVLTVSYALADCQEPVDPGPFSSCPVQRHVVGNAQTQGGYPGTLFQTAEGRPVAAVQAGRRMSVFADQRATLGAFCEGAANSSSTLSGTGRLIDKP